MKMYELLRFSVLTEVVFGLHSSGQLGVECKKWGATKVLVVTDATVAKILDEALDSLKKEGVPYVVWDKAPIDPTTEDINEVKAFLLENGCDFVVTSGGGSAMCTGKGTALMATNEGNIRDYKGRDRYKNPPLPCIAIPTTAGSGSEVSKFSIIEDEKTHIKMVAGGINSAPKVAILDPLLLRTVPRRQAIGSATDALAHCIEALVAKGATPLTDGLALNAMEMIVRNFKPSILGEELDAIGEMLFAASVANFACGNAGLGLSHGINLGLTHLYNTKPQQYPEVVYGDVHQILLPIVMEFNLPADEAKFAAMAKVLGAREEGKSQGELAAESIPLVKQLLASVGAVSKLPWKGIADEDLELVARVTLPSQQASANGRRSSEADIMSLVKQSLAGWEI